MTSPEAGGAPAALQSEFLAEIDIEVAKPPQNVGATPAGKRVVFQVAGGRIAGPHLNGVILPGAGDWVLVEPDGFTRLDVRATCRLDDGALLYMTYRGVVDPASGYFRTTPVFETGAEKYQWLTRLVCVGVGRRTPAGVAYTVHMIR